MEWREEVWRNLGEQQDGWAWNIHLDWWKEIHRNYYYFNCRVTIWRIRSKVMVSLSGLMVGSTSGNGTMENNMETECMWMLREKPRRGSGRTERGSTGNYVTVKLLFRTFSSTIRINDVDHLLLHIILYSYLFLISIIFILIIIIINS